MRTSILAVAAAALLVGIVGCSDDNGPTVSVNQFLKFTAGDSFTYDYYDRDESNARVEGSKQVYVWTVVRTDLDTLNRSGVTEVQQIRYEADGQTAVDTTMIYFVANGQGQLLEYNLLQRIVAQFQSDNLNFETVLDQIPAAWIQVGDTKSTGQFSWNFPKIQTTLNAVPVVGGESLDVVLEMSVGSNHKGATGTTVPAGVYEDAITTDHSTPTTITSAEEKQILSFSISEGDVVINDTMSLHYVVDIDGGILERSMESKSTTVLPGKVNLPYTVNGFEMELTAVQRAEAN